MPDENRVFDVTKPKHVSPGPTSRPVIVGHQPMVSDPMVKDRDDDKPGLMTHSPVKINVSDEVHEPEESPELRTGHEDDEDKADESDASVPAVITEPDKPQQPEEPVSGPAKFDDPVPVAEPYQPEESAPVTEEHSSPMVFTPDAHEETANEPIPDTPEGTEAQPAPETPLEPVPHHPDHIEGLHFAEAKHGGGRLKWLLGGLLLLVIAVYLLLDSGAISTGINLPFHVFKHDKSAAPVQAGSTTANQQPAAQTASSLPSGYKLYDLTGTNLTFAAPAAWGDPNSSTEQGYAKRGGTNQPAGNYAYLVSFAANKDVQIAVTSSQYLPPARDRQYYDYLQWCVGTNDNNYYQSILNFTTADKVDTPSTISCDQGPLAGAAKLDSSTILLPKATDAAGHVLGDIYIKNLTDKNIPVFRVKDATMTNGTDIKTILSTIKSASNS